jgi:hypothetical protein
MMGVQKIGGAQLHIEAARNGNTVQVWMNDNLNLTCAMFSTEQAIDLARMLARSIDHEPIDE